MKKNCNFTIDMLVCSVSVAKKVNGDGFADLILGTRSHSIDIEHAYISFGSYG